MLIYVEKQALGYPKTTAILSKFSSAHVVEIQHYKNIFDKKIGFSAEKCLILAKNDRLKIHETPNNYGYPCTTYFFVSQMNCVFNCRYCYLKGTFQNSFPVVFVNDEDMQEEMKSWITHLQSLPILGRDAIPIVLYASNYSDLVAMEEITGFHRSWIPFFEQFDGVMMESRTKSGNIQSLLNMGIVPKNTEIAFSLNPQEIIDQYEKGSSPLSARVSAIRQLQEKGWKVGLRFLPLLPVAGYQEIYAQFLRDIVQQIDIHMLHTVFVSTLIYNKQDWQTLRKKDADFALLNSMCLCEDGLMRVRPEVKQYFDTLFGTYFSSFLWDYE